LGEQAARSLYQHCFEKLKTHNICRSGNLYIVKAGFFSFAQNSLFPYSRVFYFYFHRKVLTPKSWTSSQNHLAFQLVQPLWQMKLVLMLQLILLKT
jgi:hypothetical protein